jgi:hypothetical protein
MTKGFGAINKIMAKVQTIAFHTNDFTYSNENADIFET